MAYVRVADPLLDSGKPGRSTDIKQIRANQDDFDSRITTVELSSIRTDQDIRDHFIATVVDTTTNWDQTLGSSGTANLVGEHTVELDSTSITTAHGALLDAKTNKLRIDKTEEYIAFMEARVKRTGANATNYRFGWNDVAHEANLNMVSDGTDFVGIRIDTVSGNWLGAISNGGSGSNTAAFGTATNWEVIQVRFTCSATAGNRKAEFYLNGTLQATLATDANMPVASLCPMVGVRANGASVVVLEVDYIEFGFLNRPLAA